MSDRPVLERDEVVAMLAKQQNLSPDAVSERLDSLDLVWLLHSVQERYGVEIDLSDGQFAAVRTISDAVAVLRQRLADAAST
jgi:acyl carrier protein